MQNYVPEQKARFLIRSIVFCAAAFLSLISMGATPVLANPAGGDVAAGSAVITASDKKLDILQSTDKAVIDWRGFDIAADEHTEFHQPSSSSMTLNRINGGTPSQIMGRLSANGNLVILNASGVLFGSGAQVDVNGLVASTAGIDTQKFMADGAMAFDRTGDPDGIIINNGSITAGQAGLVGLVAPNVVNNGTITARLGKVHLASADSFVLDLYGDGLLNFKVSDAVQKQLVANTGKVEAAGGTIALTAAAGGTVVKSLISVAGELKAPAVAEKNGHIYIFAEGATAVANNVAADKGKKSGHSTVVVKGALDASGYKTGETGGRIDVLGDNVAILNGAVLDASGDTGGGTIHVGGDYLGGGVTPTALNSFVDTYTLFYNDAVTKGDGGRTTIWSDDTTGFYGNIYGRGGMQSGNGGFAETSGHGYLDAQGYVDLTAVNGNRGTYLLDPTDISLYGNVDPAFISTDNSISLASGLKLWLDASDTANVNLTYNSLGTTATGSLGANTITVSANTSLVVGARIRLGGAGAVTAASTAGADTYTVTNIAGTTITLDSNLTAGYAGSAVYQGYVSQLTDKSGQGNSAVQAAAGNMPLWVGNGLNGSGTAKFDGVNDLLTTPAINLTGTDAVSNFTVFNYTTNPGSDYVIDEFSATFHAVTDAFAQFIANNDAGFFGYFAGLKGNGGINDEGQTALNLNAWHIAATLFDKSQPSSNETAIFINGDNSSINNTFGNGENTNAFGTYALYIGSRANGTIPLNGNISERILYDSSLPVATRNLLEQYQSAKWGIALTPSGTGATEVAKATASDGYSVFTTRYLERLSLSANVALQASNDIQIDLKGDTLNFSTAGRSLTLTAGNQIAANSAGAITTNNGNITMTAGGSGIMDIGTLNLNTAGGAVSLTSGGAMTLGTITAGSIFARTTGAASDITIPVGKALTATGMNTATTLVAGRNFINNAGAGALVAAAGRWLVYSANPANDTVGSLGAGFRRFSCAYGGACPSFSAAGNGLMYSMTPTLTATPSALAVTYRDAVPSLTGYGYSLSGYLGSDSGSDGVTGSLDGTTGYTTASNAGNYNINYSAGTLASAMGYAFSYANNASALTVQPAALTVSANNLSKIFGSTLTFTGDEFTSSGLKNGETIGSVTLTSAGAANTAALVGSAYSITPSAATGGSFDINNYALTYVAGTLTVNLLPETVIWSSQNMQTPVRAEAAGAFLADIPQDIPQDRKQDMKQGSALTLDGNSRQNNAPPFMALLGGLLHISPELVETFNLSYLVKEWR